jgi:hypothetical protein
VQIYKNTFYLRQEFKSMMSVALILDFGLRILDLRYSVGFIKGWSEAMPTIRNAKSKIQNFQQVVSIG